MTFGEKALQVLRTVAPTLAIGALGPFGPLAAAAIHVALGTDPSDPKSAETALLTATPDQLLALKKADNDFALQMKSLDISEEKLSFDDTANARAREVAVKDPTPRNLAYIYTVGFFCTLGAQFAIALAKIPIDPMAMRLIDTTTGVLFAMMLGTKEYYFGSSAGSAAKTDTINKILDKGN